MMILCNVAALPNEFNPILYSNDGMIQVDVVNDEDDLEIPDTDELPESPEEVFDFEQDLIIKAINPGYTIDNVSNVGEFIELQNLADTSFELAGYELRYTNSAGNTSILFTFPEGSYITGKHLLLRYYKSPEAELADDVYRGSGLAMSAGPLQLVYDGEVIDEICWTGKGDCVSAFKNNNTSGTAFRTTLVRNLVSGEFEHLRMEDYEPEFDPAETNLYIPPEIDEKEPEEDLLPQCRGLEFSEILTYYSDDKSEQFIEFFNPTGAEIVLDGCKINYKKKDYELTGRVSSGGYYTFYQSELFAMTKNPTNPLMLTLIDINGEVVDEIAYGSGQKKLTSYARIYDENGNEEWRTTYAITPNLENIYQQFRSCEEGKIINTATGNCVKATSTKSSATLAPCPEGQYRNPLTNRCKKIESTTSTLTPCAEGYERNPLTNRCRKITTPNEGSDYALVPNTRSDKAVFMGIGIVSMIIILGLTYVGLQFRHEIARAARIARQRFNHIRKDLFARGFGRDRNQKP